MESAHDDCNVHHNLRFPLLNLEASLDRVVTDRDGLTKKRYARGWQSKLIQKHICMSKRKVACNGVTLCISASDGGN